MLVVSDIASKLRRLRNELGTRELARRLGVKPDSLRRNFSTGKWSKRLQKQAGRLTEDVERAAIQAEPRTIVPGYSAEKIRRIMPELNRMYAQANRDRIETRNAIQRAERLKEPVLPITRQNLERFTILANKLANAAKKLVLPDMLTLEQQLELIKESGKSIDREAGKIARRFGVELKAVYTLFYSPPHLGTP